MDPRLIAYFCFTTLNALVDVGYFEDWSLLFCAMVLWRLLALILGSQTLLNPSAQPLAVSPTVRKTLFIIPYVGEACYWIGKMPFTWESDLWSVQSDLVVSLWVLQHGLSSGVYQLSETTHEMYSFYYMAAGFWKINSHFLNPRSSCATVFLCQHVAQNLGRFLSREQLVAIAQGGAVFAPIGTIIVELSMGLVLAVGRWSSPSSRRQWTKRGLLIILYFHLAVCMTPPPNNISSFALQCASRLVLLTDPDAVCVVASRAWAYRIPLIILLTSVVAHGIQDNWTPLNWSFHYYVPVMIFIHMVLHVESSSMGNVVEKGAPGINKYPIKRPLWTRQASLLAAFYSFGTIMLGTMEEASCNMFSNLKIHGGSSNHLLLPTGVLFHWFREAGDDHPYGGGEIRIEETNSDWLQLIYPNDLSHILEPEGVASDLLEAAVGAFKPNFFNAGANRVLGLRERGWIPPPPHGMFLTYSVPSLEWKRLLREAMEKDRTFSVTYAHLPGSLGDEIWRATAWERKVKLQVQNGELSSCTVQYANETELANCPSNDLPYHLDGIPWWLNKVGLYHSYPILYNPDGTIRSTIQCFGP